MQLEALKENLAQQFNEQYEVLNQLKGAIAGIDLAIRERDNPTASPQAASIPVVKKEEVVTDAND